jgi:hypothetical protein
MSLSEIVRLRILAQKILAALAKRRIAIKKKRSFGHDAEPLNAASQIKNGKPGISRSSKTPPAARFKCRARSPANQTAD